MLVAAAVVFACILLSITALFAALDAGRLNRTLADFASKRLKRPVAFATVRTHLLSARPTVTVTELKIGNAPWAGPADLLDARLIRVTLRWPTLAVTEIEVDGARANLLRATRERNNWSSGKGGGGGGFLDSVRLLRVTDGRFVFDDRVMDLRLTGSVVHDAQRNPARPLAVTAQGVLQGGEIQLSATGGALNHRPRNTPYPFSARLQDGATFLEVAGTSAGPAQLKRGFDLAVTARGPNLANMKYLINVGLPNSAPYSLTTRLSRKGPTTWARDLKAVVGQSDFAGSIVSDGSKPRRLLTADLDSQTLYAADVAAFLAHRPTHRIARSVSGAASGGGDDRVFKSKPIDLKRFRLKDARLDIKARRFVIGGVSPGRLNTVGTLDHGKFALKPFTIVFPSGRADASLAMDVNGEHPAFRLDGTLRRAELAALVPSLAKTISGTADLQVHASGAGASFHAVAMNATGTIGLTVRNGAIQASKADILSGAVVQGAFTALAHKSARSELSCALAEMGIGHGQAIMRRFLLVTDAGTAVAQGGVDLGGETVDLTLYGRPSKFRLFAVNAPVSLSGPMLHPQAKVRLGGGPSGPAPQAPKVEGDPGAFCNQQRIGAL